MLVRAVCLIAALILTQACTPDKEVHEVLPRSMTVSPAELMLEVGQTVTLSASVAPSTATDRTVTWTTSNPGRVTVDKEGTVTAISQGTAYVIAQTINGLKASSLVTVIPSEQDIDPSPDPDPTPDPGPSPDPDPTPGPDPGPDPTPDPKPDQPGASAGETFIEEDYESRY